MRKELEEMRTEMSSLRKGRRVEIAEASYPVVSGASEGGHERAETEAGPSARPVSYSGLDDDALSLFAGGDLDESVEMEETERDAFDELAAEFGPPVELPHVRDSLAKMVDARFGRDLPAEAVKAKVDGMGRPGN